MSDRVSSPTSTPAPVPQQNLDADVQVKEESPSLPSPTASIAQNPEAPTLSPSRHVRRTLAQRRAHLRDDPLTKEVEPHRVLCRRCQKWIRLSTQTEYSLANWQTHRQRCSDPRTSPLPLRRTPSKPSFSPSSRVATTERKIVLSNDPQVKVFSPGHVQCSNCKAVVPLESEVDYDLTKWTEHKTTCIPMTPASITPQGSRPRAFPPHSTSSTHSQVSAGRSARSRSPTPAGEGPSSQSTETTVVTESPRAPVKVGVKRSREEEMEDEEERPTNRARAETYEPPEKDVPSLFGWLIRPLKEFARGFREGLGST